MYRVLCVMLDVESLGETPCTVNLLLLCCTLIDVPVAHFKGRRALVCYQSGSGSLLTIRIIWTWAVFCQTVRICCSCVYVLTLTESPHPGGITSVPHWTPITQKCTFYKRRLKRRTVSGETGIAYITAWTLLANIVSTIFWTISGQLG